MPGRLPEILVAIGIGLVVVAAGVGLARLGDTEPGEGDGDGVTTSTAPLPAGCQTDDAHAAMRPGDVGPPSWQRGTYGEHAGIAAGGEMAFDPPAEIEKQLDAIAATGGRWLRVDLSWQTIEAHEGRYDWCLFDRVIAGGRARGLDVIAVPAYAPGWASSVDSLHAPPDNPIDYAEFVAAAVRRYAAAGVRVWELWNEPNTESFWAPRPDPVAYAALLRAGAAAIRAADPDAIVLTGGLAPAADEADGSRIAIDTFIETLYANGAAGSFDGLAIHPYSVPARPLTPEPWNPFAHLADYRDQLVAHGDTDLQIWLTEFGAPTGFGASAVDEDVQVEWAQEAYEAAAAWPWAGPLLWYSLRDLGEDPFDAGQNWGLLRRNFEPKPAYDDFRTLMARTRE